MKNSTNAFNAPSNFCIFFFEFEVKIDFFEISFLQNRFSYKDKMKRDHHKISNLLNCKTQYTY